MTKLLGQTVEAVRYLSPEARDDIAHVVLNLGGADAEPPVPLTPKSRPRLPSAVAPASTEEIVEMISISSFTNSFTMRLPFDQVNAGKRHLLRSTACAAASRAAAMASAAV
jgi:hypothetical protein